MSSGPLMSWPTSVAVLVLVLLLQRPMWSSCGSITRREVITASHGVVATDDGRCSGVGRDVLKDGGNAIDAAVAAALCLGVVSPASSGIGGGSFLLLRLANGFAQAFNMRETAPLLASENMYANNPDSKTSGARSIAVPGEVLGLHEAWRQHGTLPWKRLVRPAIHLAHRGFRISPFLHHQMVNTEKAIFADMGLRDLFTSHGNLLHQGSIVRNKKLAVTLDVISRHGPEAFYNGSIGINLVTDIQKAGGILTMNDLKSYRVKMTEPISAEIMGHKILGVPPPASGAAGMILILNILSRYGIPSGVSGSLGLHRLIESVKHMIAVRMNLGDPDFVDISKVLFDMLSPKYAEELKTTIYDNMTFGPDHYGGRWNQVHDYGTSHLSIIDSERNAVSMTTSVNFYFGSTFLSPSTGILLNNQMGDFSIPEDGSRPPAPANFIRPSKRPLSSMTPAIVLKDGQLKAVVGASGGGNIIAGVTEVFLNHFVKKMDPFSSIMEPRSFHQLYPNKLLYENWTSLFGDHFEVPSEIRAALQKKGHVLEPLEGGPVCQFVVHNVEDAKVVGGVVYGELTAVSDPRKGGVPAGF